MKSRALCGEPFTPDKEAMFLAVRKRRIMLEWVLFIVADGEFNAELLFSSICTPWIQL